MHWHRKGFADAHRMSHFWQVPSEEPSRSLKLWRAACCVAECSGRLIMRFPQSSYNVRASTMLKLHERSMFHYFSILFMTMNLDQPKEKQWIRRSEVADYTYKSNYDIIYCIHQI
jgi:hypothetical protein